ncbi:hypothetical protein GE061_004946 [Apolygus lucorum]|uniref:Ribosome-recycling factor, mitochondrial n=1 Tax=Apolygus lucorum TaxID=248454 RepID=A0A6A4J1T3_APOLU|nr:hypothetical protein GE061_004946 [Apolygus lucorum]
MFTRALVTSTVLVTRNLRREVHHLRYPSARCFPATDLLSLPVVQTPHRNFAKGKDIKKGKGKKKVEVNEESLSEVVNIEKIKQDMERHIEKMNEMFVKHLSVRSSTGSMEQLMVVVDGKKYPLIELGQVIRNNPKTVVINMAAFPQAIPSVLKALSESGMNLNPQQDGTTLYVPVPKVTKEHREALAKNAKTHFIKCRDGIRDVQTGCAKSLKNQEKGGLSSDLSRQVQEQVKSIADTYISQAEKMLTSKQAEVLNC